MVNIEDLQFRRNRVRQPIQYAWCAATTKNFLGTSANKISKKEIVDLDVGSLCDDIMAITLESEEGTRASLYLSSMLANGTARLFKQQTDFMLEDCEKLMLDLIGGDEVASQKKKKKTKAQKTTVHTEVLPEIDVSFTPQSMPQIDIEKILNKSDFSDKNLLSEIDFPIITEPDDGFGFDPNERELTEREWNELFNAAMGVDPEPVVPDDNAPQDNNLFYVDDAPMLPDPNLIDRQITPPDVPQPEQDVMKTPKRHPTHPRHLEEKSPSESAATAYSPPKKRSRRSHLPDDDEMVATTPTREAALPGEMPLDAAAAAAESPVFDFRRRRNRRDITLPLQRSLADRAKAVAEALAEPMITDDQPVQHESPPPAPAVDARVDLPDVSFNEQPPANVQPEDNTPDPSQNMPEEPIHATPPPAAERTTENTSTRVLPRTTASSKSDLTLDTLQSLEANPRQRYIRRGKKIFADRIKVIDVESRPADFMTMTRNEALFSSVTGCESVTSLFNNPATTKRRQYCPKYRNWSVELWGGFRKRAVAPPKETEPRQKRKKRADQSEEGSQENREIHIENMEIIDEQRQPSLPKDIPMNDEAAFEESQPRADQIPEDNVNVETTEAVVHAPPVGVRTESPENQVTTGVVHDAAAHEFEQPPPPVFEEPPLPEFPDQIEAAMSPKKRFKSKDDRDLQYGEKRSSKGLTTEELFDIIQSLWGKLKRRDIERLGFVYVEFEKVIRPGYYNSIEVARYLHHCFILEKEEKLYLEQKVPYENLYLIKW